MSTANFLVHDSTDVVGVVVVEGIKKGQTPTELGSVVGNPIEPVIELTANPRTVLTKLYRSA